MIIHIITPYGSGKTPLANKLKQLPNVMTVDLDDINDFNFMNLLKTNDEFRTAIEKKTGKAIQNLEKENSKSLKKYIDTMIGANKTLIILGSTMVPNSLATMIGEKYFVKVDSITLYRRSNLRTLETIHQNYDMLKNMIQNDDVQTMTEKSVYEHKLRRPLLIPYPMFDRGETEYRQKFVKNGYNLKTVDQIYTSIANRSQ